MDIYCSSPRIHKGKDYGEKCKKYLGTYDLLIGLIYCKSCKKKNYYEVITDEGLQKLKKI